VSSYYAGCQPRQTEASLQVALHPAIKPNLQGKEPTTGRTEPGPYPGPPTESARLDQLQSLQVADSTAPTSTSAAPRYIPPREKENPFQVPVPRCEKALHNFENKSATLSWCLYWKYLFFGQYINYLRNRWSYFFIYNYPCDIPFVLILDFELVFLYLQSVLRIRIRVAPHSICPPGPRSSYWNIGAKSRNLQWSTRFSDSITCKW
jgi:hypothetical protein